MEDEAADCKTQGHFRLFLNVQDYTAISKPNHLGDKGNAHIDESKNHNSGYSGGRNKVDGGLGQVQLLDLGSGYRNY